MQHGDKLRLKGKGIYDPQRGVKGDQYVELRIVLPKKLSQKQVGLHGSSWQLC